MRHRLIFFILGIIFYAFAAILALNSISFDLILVSISIVFLAAGLFFDMSEIAKAHTLTLQLKASQRFPSMLKNTLCTLVRSVFDTKQKMAKKPFK